MQLSTLISGLGLLAATVVTGIALPQQLAPAAYSGTYNGHDYSIQADHVAHAAEQLAALYGPQTRDVSHSLNDVERAALEKRNKDTLLCIPVDGHGWRLTKVPDITDGINALNRIGGTIDIGHQCALLTCNGDAGIFLCNDNPYRIQPGILYLATYAQDIRDRCLVRPNFDITLAGGQEFDTDRYNVIIKEDCDAP